MYKVTSYLEEIKPTSRRIEAIEYALKTFKLTEESRKELEDHVESNLALDIIKENILYVHPKGWTKGKKIS